MSEYMSLTPDFLIKAVTKFDYSATKMSASRLAGWLNYFDGFLAQREKLHFDLVNFGSEFNPEYANDIANYVMKLADEWEDKWNSRK